MLVKRVWFVFNMKLLGTACHCWKFHRVTPSLHFNIRPLIHDSYVHILSMQNQVKICTVLAVAVKCAVGRGHRVWPEEGGAAVAAAAGTKGLKSETSSAWPIPRAGRKKRATNSFLKAHFPIGHVTRDSKVGTHFYKLIIHMTKW